MSARWAVASRVVRYWKLPLKEKLTTLRALVTLIVLELLIRWVRLPALADFMGVTLAATGSSRSRADQPSADPMCDETIAQAIRATGRVIQLWPFGRGPCLRQSLVLGRLLRRRDPVLRLGVANGGDGFVAHAWLEVDGYVLGDSHGFRPFEQTTSSATI